MGGMARDVGWVCGNCRAINDRRSSRCYSCRAPRALAVDAAAATASSAPISDRARPDEQAKIAREGGATYRSSALLAIFVELAIVVVTALHVARLGPLIQLLPAFGQFDAGDFASIDQATVRGAALTSAILLAAEGAAWILGFIAWGAWLSRVVANVPALGAGWTRASPREAFLSSIVPIYNLFWMPAAVRDAAARLSSPKPAPQGLVSAWWLTLVIAVLPGLGLIPGPLWGIRLVFQVVGFVLSYLIFTLPNPYTLSLLYGAAYTLLLLPAALLAFAVVLRLEALQEAKLAAQGASNAVEPGRPTHALTPAASAAGAVDARQPVAFITRSEQPRRVEVAPSPDLPDLGQHTSEVEAFIASLGMMNRDEAGRVHRQGLASGAGGGSRWASLDRQLDGAAVASGLGPARLEAQRRATRASARSDARLGNRYVIADECAGVWAAVLVLRDHLPRATAAMAFEPWEDVLVRPAWL